MSPIKESAVSMLIEQDSDAAALRRGTRRFLIIGLLIALAVVVAILVRQGLFRQTATLGFVANSAQDLSKGLPVKIAGFRVGSVSAVTLRPDGKVEVAVEIDAHYMGFVTRDAIFELRKEGLVGSSALEIISGPDKSVLATDQAKLDFIRDEGIAGVANQLKGEIIPILRDIKVITGTLADKKTGLPATQERVHNTLESLNTLLANGNHQVSQVSTVTTRVLKKTEDNLNQLSHTLETTNKNLPELLGKTQRIADHVEKITGEAEASLPPVLRDGSAVTKDVREIVAGAKTAWPIRNLIDAPAPANLKVDSDPHAQSVGR